MDMYISQLDHILSDLFNKYASLKVTPGVLLSGGIDSSIVTYYVSLFFSKYEILSMGTKNTKDKEFVQRMCTYLNHPFSWLAIDEQDIKNNIDTVQTLLQKAGVETSLMQASLAIGYYLIFKKAHEQGITHVFTGQGPDILLAGYHKYKEVTDINHEIQQDLPLLETDKKRDAAMASYFGITLINPYLEKEFVDFSLTIPAEYKIHEGVEKYLLREFARVKGLPISIINRPKKAYQYSTGLQNMVRKILR